MQVTLIHLSYFLATRVIATYTASWKMKRKQPVGVRRSARVRRSGKSPKIHHELRPIVSSCSSSAACSSQLRMAPGHQWDTAEEVVVFDEARTILAGNPQYPSKAWLHRQISDRLNERFSGPFNGPMVKAKLSLFRERWRSQGHIAPGDRVLYTTRERIRVTDHEATFEALFAETDGESTNSGAVSLESEPGGSGPVNGSGPVSFSCSSSKKKELSPEVQAAIAFMAAGNGEQRSTGRELLIFTTMLNNVPYLLSNFNALPNDYEVRRTSLIDVFKLGGQGVPNIPQDKLPQDFL